MKKENDIKVIIENPPTNEHKKIKLEELAKILSNEISEEYKAPKTETGFVI